jgi:nucleoside-diphosphate-sugar epimerase
MAGESVSGTLVVVTGAAGELGRAVCGRAAADPAVAKVVGVDRLPMAGEAKVVPLTLDLATADLKPVFEGATVLVHLAQPDGGSALGDAELTHRVLDAAGAVGVEHLVLLSSAAAYGAWANNPVPLTEEAALRPNPGVDLAAAKAEIERAAAEFRDEHPGTTVSLLRPTVTVATGGGGRLARALDRRSFLPVARHEPPAQFLAVGDLAAAVDLARRLRIDGPRNVAPDGWIEGDAVRALAGGRFLWLPERLAIRVARTRWRWGMAPTPPELLPLVVHPWAVANDRLRGDGWVPEVSNEAALAAAPGPGARSPGRGRALALAGAAVIAVALVRRRRRL